MSATTILRKIKDIQNFEANNTTTVIVKHNYHLQEIVSLANWYKFMAFDCEWVPKSEIKVALLQLSFPNGKCFLVSSLLAKRYHLFEYCATRMTGNFGYENYFIEI